MTVVVSCKHCSLDWAALRKAVKRAERRHARGVPVDTEEIDYLKARIADCASCAGTGDQESDVPISSPRPLVKKPAAPKPVPAQPTRLDPTLLKEALADAAAKNTKPPGPARGTAGRTVTGRCHDCEKQIPWGRLFCGRCTSERER